MPALEGTNAKVLVTGANGYVAMWIIRHLLEQGYAVRGTVRSKGKETEIKDCFGGHVESGQLEFVHVEDVSKKGAFDEAVKGIDAVIHAASPVYLTDGHPDEIVLPAVQATVGVLQSCLAHGQAVQRVVITSSTGAILQSGEQNPRVYSENDWNDNAVDNIRKLGKDAIPLEKYQASKVLAERAAWDFVKLHKNDIGWDLCVINPSFVFGPFINNWKDLKSISASSKAFYDNILNLNTPSKQLLGSSTNCADVRDVALVHVLALQKSEAGGERLLVSAHNLVWQDLAECAHALDPPPSPPRSLPPLQDGVQKMYTRTYDSSKIRRILGIKFRTMEEMVRDTLECFNKNGI